jgi:hypothetical protein
MQGQTWVQAHPWLLILDILQPWGFTLGPTYMPKQGVWWRCSKMPSSTTRASHNKNVKYDESHYVCLLRPSIIIHYWVLFHPFQWSSFLVNIPPPKKSYWQLTNKDVLKLFLKFIVWKNGVHSLLISPPPKKRVIECDNWKIWTWWTST